MNRLTLFTIAVVSWSAAAWADETPATAQPSTPGVAAEAPTPPPPPPAVVADPSAAKPAVAPAPAAAPEPNAIKLADRANKRRGLSAGPGGPLFAFTEIIAGLALGGTIGGSFTANSTGSASNGAYFGAVAGGLGLGALAIALQYELPIGLSSAGLSAVGAIIGTLAGAGLWDLVGQPSGSAGPWMALAFSQVGALVPFFLLMGDDDLKAEDLGLIGMTSAYAFVFTGLTMIAMQLNNPRMWPLLISPAVGMLIGAGWATQADISGGRLLKLTALPLGVGLLLFYLGGTMASNSMSMVAVTTMVGIVATFGLTFLFTQDDTIAAAPAKGHATVPGPRVLPSVAVAPAGMRNEGIAAGPAVLVTF